MISEKRQSLILQELKKKDFLSLQELIERTGCSASTIRRDLSKLQQLGRLQRVHGGATLKKKKKLEERQLCSLKIMIVFLWMQVLLQLR